MTTEEILNKWLPSDKYPEGAKVSICLPNSYTYKYARELMRYGLSDRTFKASFSSNLVTLYRYTKCYPQCGEGRVDVGEYALHGEIHLDAFRFSDPDTYQAVLNAIDEAMSAGYYTIEVFKYIPPYCPKRT